MVMCLVSCFYSEIGREIFLSAYYHPHPLDVSEVLVSNFIQLWQLDSQYFLSWKTCKGMEALAVVVLSLA